MTEREVAGTREALEQEIAQLRARLGQSARDETRDSLVDQHPADAATDLYERERDLGRLLDLEQRVRAPGDASFPSPPPVTGDPDDVARPTNTPAPFDPRSNRMSSTQPDPEEMRRQIVEMDEGQGAGPDAPETVEPVHGAGREPGIPWDSVSAPGWHHRDADDDSHAGPVSAAGVGTWRALRAIGRRLQRFRDELSRGRPGSVDPDDEGSGRGEG
jgi:hypothetical protein